VTLVPYVSKHHISPAVCVCTEFVVVSAQVSPQAGRGLCLTMQKLIEGREAGSYLAVAAQSAIIVSADSDGHFLISQTIGAPGEEVTNIIHVTAHAMPALIDSLQRIKFRADAGLYDSRTNARNENPNN